MGFGDILGKVGKAAVNGAAWYLEEAAASNSRSKNYTDEQREGMADFSNRMHEFRDNFNGRNQDDDDDDDYYY